MADLPRLVCASANPDKVAEIALVLTGSSIFSLDLRVLVTWWRMPPISRETLA